MTRDIITLPDGRKAAVVQPETGSPSQEKQRDRLEDFIPFLEGLRRYKTHLTTAPTFTPKNLLEQIQFYDDEATPTPTRRLYLYVNRGWRYISLT